MKHSLFKKAIFLISVFSLLMPFLTWAITIVNPLHYTTFEELINAIINFIFWVAIVIVPIMVIVAAYFFLTSGGDPAKTGQAKKIILYTLIGLFIVLLGRGIVSVIGSLFGGGGGPGPGCTCTSWLNDACGAGGCPANEMHQTRTCNPPGCDVESQCILDLVCGPGGGLTPAKLTKLGDFTGSGPTPGTPDCRIEGQDLAAISFAFGPVDGNPTWDAQADLNKDGVVDNYDVLIISKITFGRACGDPVNSALLTKLGDISGSTPGTPDCRIQIDDILAINVAFGPVDGNPTWDAQADLNKDGVVDLYDTLIISKITFGWVCD